MSGPTDDEHSYRRTQESAPPAGLPEFVDVLGHFQARRNQGAAERLEVTIARRSMERDMADSVAVAPVQPPVSGAREQEALPNTRGIPPASPHDGAAERYLRSRWMGDLSAIPLGKVTEFMEAYAAERERAAEPEAPEHENLATCWCRPRLAYRDPVTGNEVYVHKDGKEESDG